MKKVISILVSVMMILTAIPAFADGAAVAPASVDIYEALDNTASVPASVKYTKNAPYTTSGGFSAPTTTNLEMSFIEDSEEGEIARVEYVSETAENIYGGAELKVDSLNAGPSGTNKKISYTTRIRRNTNNYIYWYLIDDNGARQENLMCWWPSSSSNRLWWGRTNQCTEIRLADNTWYTVTFELDFENAIYTVYVDGGAHNNVKHTASAGKLSFSSSTIYDGIGVGYLAGTHLNDSYDLAYVNISNKPLANSYSEILVPEKTSLKTHTSGAWESGNWSISQAGVTNWISKNAFSVVDTNSSHGYAMKITPPGHTSTLPISCDVSNALTTVGSDGKLIIEGSYLEHGFGHFRIHADGVLSSGQASTLKIFEFGGANWGYTICNDTATTYTIPKALDKWRRVRVIMDLKKGEVTVVSWLESQPETLEINHVNTAVLANYKNFNTVTFQCYTRFTGYYAYLDDFKVYNSSTLSYTGSNPVNGGANAVSVTDDPTLLFNMPIKATTATTSNVTLTDSEGTAVAGTVGLSAQRNGISFYPASDLKPEETYTLIANCAVTDEFGSTVNVAKTITFTTEPLLTLVDFEFSNDEVVAGDLGATIEVKSKDKLPKNIYAALAIYNKSTGELVSINTGSINAVTNTFNLTAEVPEAGEYYAKAFVWNTDANAVPYFTAQSIGLN